MFNNIGVELLEEHFRIWTGYMLYYNFLLCGDDKNLVYGRKRKKKYLLVTNKYFDIFMMEVARFSYRSALMRISEKVCIGSDDNLLSSCNIPGAFQKINTDELCLRFLLWVLQENISHEVTEPHRIFSRSPTNCQSFSCDLFYRGKLPRFHWQLATVGLNP